MIKAAGGYKGDSKRAHLSPYTHFPRISLRLSYARYRDYRGHQTCTTLITAAAVVENIMIAVPVVVIITDIMVDMVVVTDVDMDMDMTDGKEYEVKVLK